MNRFAAYLTGIALLSATCIMISGCVSFARAEEFENPPERETLESIVAQEESEEVLSSTASAAESAVFSYGLELFSDEPETVEAWVRDHADMIFEQTALDYKLETGNDAERIEILYPFIVYQEDKFSSGNRIWYYPVIINDKARFSVACYIMDDVVHGGSETGEFNGFLDQCAESRSVHRLYMTMHKQDYTFAEEGTESGDIYTREYELRSVDARIGEASPVFLQYAGH